MNVASQIQGKKDNEEEKKEILISGEISDFFGTDLNSVKNLLESSDSKNINILINSPGGSVTEGLAIAAFIKNFPANISTTVIGLAASIATPIALAGDSVFMDKDSFFMVHNPWAFTAGESDDLRETADLLDKMKDNLANIYVAKIKQTGKLISGRTDSTFKQVVEWMNNETWFTAQEALDAGLIDGIVDRKEKQDEEKAKSILNSCSKFKNVPTAFLNKIKNIVDMNDNIQNTKKEEKEVSFWEKLVNIFSTKPKEVKALIEDLDQKQEEEENAKLQQAKELLLNSGFVVTEQQHETEEEETIEQVEETETIEEDSELLALKEKLAKAQAEKEAAQAKLQKIEEEKSGGPSAGDGGNTEMKKSNSHKYAPTAEHKEALKAVGKIFN